MKKSDIKKFKENMQLLLAFCVEKEYKDIQELCLSFLKEKESDYEWWKTYLCKEILKDYKKKEFGNGFSMKQINLLIDNIQENVYLWSNVYPKKISKEQEIEIIKGLMNSKFYFNEQFSDEQIQSMIQNIQNDFPLLFGIEIKK